LKLNIVPARTGIAWVKLGVQTFLKQPLALTGLFFMYMAVVLVMSQLPLVGPVLAAMLVPAATLGLMAATAEAESGRFPMPTVLISAFRAGKQRARAMLVLGVLYTVGFFLLTSIGVLLVGEPQAVAATAPAGAAAARLDPRMLVLLALQLPLLVLFWHAPALVHWHGVSPVKSLFFSAVAVFRNLGAFLVYGITWFGVIFIVSSGMGILGALLGGDAGANSILIPTLLILMTMFFTSLYFTFRDSFRADGDAELPAVAPAGEDPK
jgi:hypothetical protein